MKKAQSKYGPLCRGDWNQDKTKRFWGYLKGREMWVSPKQYEWGAWWK